MMKSMLCRKLVELAVCDASVESLTGFSIPVREWIGQGLGVAVTRERGLRGWTRFVMARQVGMAGACGSPA